MKLFLLISMFAGFLYAEELVVRTVRTDGEVQIKREGERKWGKLKKNNPLHDNDLVQTSFKSNCEIRMGDDNVLMLGTNSRFLINITEKSDGFTEISITLFAGSIYSKIISNIRYFVYSSTAMGRTDKGIFNFTVDEASGICGFHVFAGSVTISNISVQGEQVVKPGDMTTVPPGGAPVAPTRINAKQMSILTRFYGADFINQEIEASGIEIVSSSETGQESMGKKSETPTPNATPSTSSGGQRKLVRIFDKDALLGKIEAYEMQHEYRAKTPAKNEALERYHYRLNLVLSPMRYRGKFFPDGFLRPGYFSDNLDVSLNLPVVAGPDGKTTVDNFNSIRDGLDKIQSVDYRYRKHRLHIGDIRDLTIGSGVLMRNYSNRVLSDNVRNTGLLVHLENYQEGADLFMSDISTAHLAGLHLYHRDTTTVLGLAVIREAGQRANLNNGDFGFRNGEGSLPDTLPSPDKVSQLFVQGDYQINLINNAFERTSLYASLVTCFWNNQPNLKAWELTLPGLNRLIGRFEYQASFFLGRNRLFRNRFNAFYEDNLYLVQRASTTEDSPTGAVTFQSLEPKTPTHVGLSGAFRTEPVRGLRLFYPGYGRQNHPGTGSERRFT